MVILLNYVIFVIVINVGFGVKYSQISIYYDYGEDIWCIIQDWSEVKLEIGILRSEFREGTIRNWREAGEKGENREGEFIRDSDSLREREWTQDKSVVIFYYKALIR
jgi:hypothetical protein